MSRRLSLPLKTIGYQQYFHFTFSSNLDGNSSGLRLAIDTPDWIRELGILNLDLLIGHHFICQGDTTNCWEWKICGREAIHFHPGRLCLLMQQSAFPMIKFKRRSNRLNVASPELVLMMIPLKQPYLMHLPPKAHIITAYSEKLLQCRWCRLIGLLTLILHLRSCNVGRNS